jgi:hypothetical protein
MKGLRAKRVEALLAFGTDFDETRLVQYAQMPRDSRLVDLNFIDKIINRALATSKCLDDAQTHGVGQSLKDA